MKTTILQSLFKIALLLFGMVVGVGCDDSDNPDNRIQEGIEISGILTKNRRKRYRDQVPNGDNPLLDLKKRSHIEGDAVCNSIKGDYKYSADNGQFKIEGLIATELGCTSPHHEAETMYLDYFRKISSFKQDRENVRFYFGENSYLEYKSISEKNENNKNFYHRFNLCLRFTIGKCTTQYK